MKSDKKPSPFATVLATIAGIATVSLFVLGALTVEAIATMVAWGLVIPDVFGLKFLSFYDAIGLVLLANFALMPIAFPLNSMNSTLSKYAKARESIDLLRAVRDVSIEMHKKDEVD